MFLAEIRRLPAHGPAVVAEGLTVVLRVPWMTEQAGARTEPGAEVQASAASADELQED